MQAALLAVVTALALQGRIQTFGLFIGSDTQANDHITERQDYEADDIGTKESGQPRQQLHSELTGQATLKRQPAQRANDPGGRVVAPSPTTMPMTMPGPVCSP